MNLIPFSLKDNGFITLNCVDFSHLISNNDSLSSIQLCKSFNYLFHMYCLSKLCFLINFSHSFHQQKGNIRQGKDIVCKYPFKIDS